jgi:hypothetical protein
MSEEYEDLELEFDLTDEQLAEIEESLKFSNIRYVYFDKVTGDIASITDKKNLKLDVEYFEIESETLHSLIPTNESSASFKVVTDLNNKFDIVPKVVTLNSKSSTLTVIPYTNESTTVTIFNDIENKKWVVVLDETERQRLHNAVANYTKQVYVTAQENKNILYRVFNVDLNTLISVGSVTIPHEMIVESITSKIRLSTIRFFDSYALKEMYEPKI